MQSYNARYASFSPKPRSKLSKTSDLRWPHPASFLATPTSLASAGFYFNPSTHTPDAVSCFICDKGLADWDPEDDPAEIHSQKCPKCPWAVLKCMTDTNDNGSLKVTSSSRLPSSRPMEKARLATFGPDGKKWWPHDGKNKGPSSKTMAKAGFIYFPVDNKDDTCTCIYCGIELAGWEPEDDPIEEHRRRQDEKNPCPFFTTPSVTSESTRRVRSKSKPPPVIPVASSSNREYHPNGTRSVRTSKNKQPESSTKSKSTAKSSKKASKAKAIEQEVVVEYHIALDADEDAPPKPRPRSRRASSWSRSTGSSRSRSRASSTKGTTADETDLDLSSTLSALVSTKKPQSKHFPSQEEMDTASVPDTQSTLSQSPKYPKDIPSAPLASEPALQSLSNHFDSPEDEELAREEQALEEQARELMLADTTHKLDSSLPHKGEKSRIIPHDEVGEDASFQNPFETSVVAKDKCKTKVPPAETAINNTVGPPIFVPSTPPRPAPIVKAPVASVVRFPKLLPEETLPALTEVDRAMTVEQWIRHEMDCQYERLLSEGRQKIDAFKARAIEVARQIESL